MRPGEKEIGRFWARWAPTHKHSIRRRCGNNLCIPQEMEIKNLRWVLTWHLKETDLARILEGRNAMLASILLRKNQKTSPYPSRHYENLFLNMLYSCYVRCSLFPHSSFHLFDLAKFWRCYVKHIRAPHLSHIRREKAHHPHGTAAIQKSHIR